MRLGHTMSISFTPLAAPRPKCAPRQLEQTRREQIHLHQLSTKPALLYIWIATCIQALYGQADAIQLNAKYGPHRGALAYLPTGQ
jgi:hypothetical protein